MLNYNKILLLAQKGNNKPVQRIEKTESQWRELLSPDQFQITRKKGTESRMSSGLCTLYDPGIYGCVCCGTDLFNSTTKYDSHSGWPSFTEPVADNVISYHNDNEYGMNRIEVLCSTCDAHLGHVFPDGPEPTGLRFCINGASLQKVK
jgi:peptide-methionine (R)-S-oxide reductase